MSTPKVNPTMNLGMKRTARIGAATAVLAVVGLTTGPAAFAASQGDVQVVNTETVQAYLGADGHVESKRVYEQLALTGHGSVDLANPISTDDLRNIDGFGEFTVRGHDQIVKTTVDGIKRYRSVSTYAGSLPISVTPAYTLDGKTVKPGDVVGKHGKLQVTFTVVNKTTRSEQLTVSDGNGGTVTKTVEVPLPLVGQLTTTLPKTFTDVKAGAASAAGDGQGGTVLNFNLVMFPPVGATTAKVGYTTKITDGVVPRVDVALLPVDPLASPTFKTATDGYSTGAQTGAQLVTGAQTIDANLLKLRDGASSLLAGLIKLSDGADQLDSGVGKLDDGAGQLHRGTSDALAGAKKLNSGLGQISGGLGQLAGQLPAAGPGIQKLIDGVNQLVAGFGAVGQANTLIDGLAQLDAGAGALKTGLSGQIVPGIGASKAGVDQVRAGLNDAIKAGGSIDQLLGGLNAVLAADCGPACQAIISGGVLPGVQSAKTSLTAAYAGLGQVSGGLQQVLDGLNGQIIPGLGQLETGAAAAKAGAADLKAGNLKVRDGLTQLKTKLAAAIAGVLQLSSGAKSAYTGSGDLTDGLGKLNSGSGDLASGTGQLADGSGQLASGLKTASGGAPQLVDGTGRLSKEGMGPLIGKGKETAVSYGELYAELAAGAKRARTESMAYGAPTGAVGLTAYSFVIRGDDGESGRNLTRALAALGLVGLAGGVTVLRRRMAV